MIFILLALVSKLFRSDFQQTPRQRPESRRGINVFSLGVVFGFSVRPCRWVIAYKFFVRQPAPGNGGYHLSEPTAVVVGTLIEPECLLIGVSVQMNRVNADVGSLESALQERPKVLDSVDVNVAVHELYSMVDSLMVIGIRQTEIGLQSAGVDRSAGFDTGANLWCEGLAPYIRDMSGFDSARFSVTATLNDSQNRFLPGAARPLDFSLVHMPMHVLGEAANEHFIGLYLFAYFQKRASLHGEPDTMIHEPGCFLRNTERPVHLVTADSVLAVRDHPDRGKPTAKVNRAILENGSDLG